MHSQGTFAILVLLGLNCSILAAPLLPSRTAGARGALDGVPFADVFTDGSPANVNQTFLSGDGSTLVSNAFAVSTYGSFGVRTSSDLDRKSNGNGWSYAFAAMTDVMTIDFAPLTGRTGFMLVNYRLDGTINESGIVNSQARVFSFVDLDGVGTGLLPVDFLQQVFSSSTSGLFSTPRALRFVYGQPFHFRFGLDVVSGTASIDPVSGSLVFAPRGVLVSDLVDLISQIP